MPPHRIKSERQIPAFPDADLQKFKAAMPQVQVKLTPMKPDYRKMWDETVAAASKKTDAK